MRWVIGCVLLGCLQAPLRAEDPSQTPVPLPTDPSSPAAPLGEVPLEGEALAAYEREKKEILLSLRKEKNRELVARQIDVLGTRGSRAGRDALIAFVKETKNQEYLDHAFRALARIGGPPVVELLTGKLGLRADDFLVQQSAAAALETVKDPKATAALLDVLADKRTKIEVIGAVSKALARSAPGDEHVAEALFELTEHPKDTIRSYALEAIGWLGTDPAVERLKKALKEEKNTRARGAAATGMGHTKRPELVPVLEAAIAAETAMTVKDCASRAIQELEGGHR